MSAADGRKLGPRPATLDRLRSKKAIRVDHTVVLDNDAAKVLNDARTEMSRCERVLATLKARDPKPSAKELTEAQKALDEAGEAYNDAREQAAEVTVVFKLKAVPGHQLDKLARQNRVTEDDREKMREEGMTDEQIDAVPHSPSKWPVVCIAATVDEPKMTASEVRELIWENDEWNQQEREQLLRACTSVNNGQAWVDLGKAFGEDKSNGLSKSSRTASASRAASS